MCVYEKRGLRFQKRFWFQCASPSDNLVTFSLCALPLAHLCCACFLTKIKFNTRQLRGVMCRHGSRFKGVCKNFHLVYDHFVFHLVETFEAA